MKKQYLLIIAIVIVLAFIGVVVFSNIKKATDDVKNPVVTMELEGYGTVQIELYPDIAPNTVANFIALSNNGFYDGLTFHRIVKDFMIQGGDSKGDGTGSPTLSAIDKSIEAGSEKDTEYCINGEFSANGYKKNDLKHSEYVISMARSDYSSINPTLAKEGYNSAGSQFFIMTKSNSTLNGKYAAFGKVISGFEVIDAIENAEVQPAKEEGGEASTPVTAPIIKSMKVDTFGKDYGLPTTGIPFDYNAWLMNYYGIDANSMVTE